MNDGLKDSHRAAVIGVIAANERVERALLFGSRATETHTVTSDIDIALFGDRLTLTDQARLAAAAEELAIPQRVDFLLHTMIDSDTLRKHIERDGVQWYRQASRQGALQLRLSPKHWGVIEALLCEHLPGVEVWACARRVTGSSHDGSNLDLVLRGPGLRELPANQLGDFQEAVRDSNIPLLVEAHDWARLPERFRREIEQKYVTLVKNKSDVATDDWMSIRLGDVCTKIGSGATPRGGKEVYLQEGPFSLIRSQNVYNNRFSHEGLVFITERHAAELDNVEVFPDDVLLNITGDSVARTCQVTPDVLPARVSQHVAIIRPDTSKLSARFLRYFLVCPTTQAMLLSWAGSGGTRNALTKSMIESLEIFAPDNVVEQRAIAHILGTLDDKIELNRRLNETLEAVARAIFKDWFVDFGPTRAKTGGCAPYLAPELWDLFPDTLDDQDKPVGWNKKAMGDLCEVVIGGLWGKDQSGSADLEEYYCLRGVDLQHLRELGEAPNVPSRFAKSTALEKRCVTRNDILIASSGAGPCGRSLWVGIEDFFNGRKDRQRIIYSNFVKRLHCISPSIACFLDMHLNEMRVSGEIQKYISGTSVPNLNDKGLLQSHQIVLPPEPLLDAFLQFALIAQKRLLCGENATLAQTRDLLLPKLMSGEIRLCEAEKAVETVA